MRKKPFAPFPWYPLAGVVLLLLFAYGRLLLRPDLHIACPENDTWNLPIRWSVFSALRQGRLPLWNPLSAFGMPWLATWQTETFYPGTLVFTWLGLSAWNLSGVLHLFILSTGLYLLLRGAGAGSFWAFFSAGLAALNACAFNHLGSNSSMDTMAWVPWILKAVRDRVGGRPRAAVWLALFIALQVFAGYPQIIFYTVLIASAYACFLGGSKALGSLAAAFSAGIAVSLCQWLPSLEYFFLHSVRLPADPANPHFYLPAKNLITFILPHPLGEKGTPDYVASPTYFYFNFHSGLVLPLFLLLGLIRFRKLQAETRFFLAGFFFLLLWALGIFLGPLDLLHIPFPAFLEPAKSWVVVDILGLGALGLILKDFFPAPGPWKWALLALGFLNLLVPVWDSPLERNYLPGDPALETQASMVRGQLGSGRVLALPSDKERASIYTPLPDPAQKPFFKHFVPNSNLFAGIPLANFYGSTWPGWGVLDAQHYLQSAVPFWNKNLLDLLGVDLMLLNEDRMPPSFQKISTDGVWTLWKNPGSVGSHFMFTDPPRLGTRQQAFEAFTNTDARPSKDLFLDPQFISLSPCHSLPRDAEDFGLDGQKGFLIVTQTASPGWRAWVDGTPSDLFMADGLLQAVPVGSGSKRLFLAYEPASFRLGLFLSLLSLAMVALWVTVRFQGKGRPT